MVDILAIQRVSVSASGTQSNGDLTGAGFSADGTKVFFYGGASNILSIGTARGSDVFMKDLNTGVVTLVSSDASGVAGSGLDIFASISDDGNLVAFKSNSVNLSPLDTNTINDIYVKNIATGAVTLVSSTAAGVSGDAASGGTSAYADISSDGSRVVFETQAKNLVTSSTGAADTATFRDIVVKDMGTGEIITVSQSAAGVLGNSNSSNAVFSPDGTKVAFQSTATNLLALLPDGRNPDTNGQSDIFIKDLVSGEVTRVSTGATGAQASGGASITPVFSADGTKIVFASAATDLVAGDTNGVQDIFVKNLITGAVTLVSSSASGAIGNGASNSAIFSPDGTKVAFISSASSLVSGDSNGVADVFVKDLVDGTIVRVNTSIAGVQADLLSVQPYFSADGTKLMFSSYATNLVADKTTATQDVYVVTLATNHPVVTTDDALAANAGQSLSNIAATLKSNDTDPEGLAFNVTAVDTAGTLGSVSFNNVTHEVGYAATHASFTPLAQGQSVVDSFTYTVTDSAGNTSTATVHVTVSGVNDAPQGLNDVLEAVEDNTLIISKASLLANDTDVDHGAALSVTGITANVTHGTLTDNGDGTYTYTPAANYNGADGFTYSLTDEHGAISSASVTLNVAAVNDAPVAVDDTLAVTVGDTAADLAATVLANDSDQEGDALSVTVLNTSGTLGDVTLNVATQALSYQAGSAFASLAQGETTTDSFAYTVTDAGGASHTATVTMTVTGVNDGPVAVDDVLSTDEDNAVVFSIASLLSNDTDADNGAVLSFVGITTTPTHGALVDNGDGTLSFTPDAHYFGTDSFTYTMTDEYGATSTATVTFTVNSVNDAPVVIGETLDANEDEGLVITAASLLANESDTENDALSIASITVDPAHGTLTNNGDGTYTYLSAANYNGSDGFTYLVTDSNGATATGEVVLNVYGVNDAPVATNDDLVTNEDTTLVISIASLMGNDSDADADAVLSFVGIDTTTAHGTLVDNGDGSLSYTYTPSPDFNGADSFTYTITDEHGVTSTATATITVEAVNDAPVTTGETLDANEDEALVITAASLLANDTDADGDTLTIAAITVDPAHGTLTNNGDGTYTYLGNADFSGVDGFTYQVSDGNGGLTTAQVVLNVAAVNDAPVAQADAFTTNEDTPLIISYAALLANDADADVTDTLTIDSILVDPAHGTLTDNGNGTFTYLAARDYFGADSFTYRMSDGQGGFSEAAVSLTIIAQGETITGSAYTDVLTGSDMGDLISGMQGSDTIDALQGDDSVNAGSGNDLAYGGEGKDTVGGYSGNDTLYGGDGDDRVLGYSENDVLYGDAGVDTLDGGSEHDSLYGGAGNDRLYGKDGRDMLSGDADNDRAEGGLDADTLYGGLGNDSLYGDEDADALYGDEGNDRLYGGVGADALYGGVGADSLYGEEGDDSIAGEGDLDRVYGGAGNDTLEGGEGDDRLYGEADDDSLIGGLGADSLEGAAGNDTLEGGDGADRLLGGEGSDLLIAGLGKDYLTGGDGADIFKFTSLLDSTATDRDLIYDYVDGVDKIDIQGLGFTSVSAVTPLAVGALRIQYSSSTDMTYLRDTASGFMVGLSGNHLAELDNSDFIF